MWIKRALALLGVLLFMAVLVFVPVFLYADTLYRQLLDAHAAPETSNQETVTAFSLYAEENEQQSQARIAGWLSAVSSQEVSVSSVRGKLAGMQYEPVSGEMNVPTVIVFHGGLGTDRNQVLDIACALSLQGYRVITPDLYAHGESEGDASTLGYGDAQDVHAGIDYVKKAQPGVQILLFGVDEGAAAVLTAACRGLDASVLAVAADSVCDDALMRLQDVTGEAEGSLRFFLIKTVFARKNGADDQKISEQIAAAKTPLLLIHGTGDQVVPAWHSEDIALAAGENAKLLYVEGAEHGMSRFVAPELYYGELFAFYENALK